ncbi:MAG: GNAT family N-acetyltransferase [Thermoleophilaceae bacterium]
MSESKHAARQPTIRDAMVVDLEAIFAIYNDEGLRGTATFDTEPLVVERDRDWLTARDADRHPVVVAESDGRVVGWAGLNPWSSRRAYARTAEVSVYVHRDARGRAVGRSLLAAIIERAREADLGVVLARIAEANEPSVRLFEHFCFGHIGTQRRCGEKFGRILDVELMDLHLDDR